MVRNLSVRNVMRIYRECLLRDDEEGAAFVTAECDQTVKFHRGRLNDHRPAIIGMLAELPDAFRTHSGAGFYDASETKDGERWVKGDGREDNEIEALVLLGLAIDEVQYIKPLKDCDDFPDFRVRDLRC